jgi:hypothetical protein
MDGYGYEDFRDAGFVACVYKGGGVCEEFPCFNSYSHTHGGPALRALHSQLSSITIPVRSVYKGVKLLLYLNAYITYSHASYNQQKA